MGNDAWRRWCLYVPAIALFGLIFGPVLFARAGYVPATHECDFYMYYFPMTEAAFELLRRGIVPLWNPYLYSGMPFLASIEIGVLYPPNWLHLFVPAERAFCLLYVFHLLLAAGGAWLYARGRGRSRAAALLTALAFSFAAPTILHFDAGMTSIVYSSAWCPLIFALVDCTLRRRTFHAACGLAAALACQFLAGFPLFTLLLAVLVPIYVFVFGVEWRKPLDRSNGAAVILFGAAAILTLGLVAPQLLATLEYLDNSHRGELNYEQATHCCFPAPNLVTFIVPEFFGNERSCAYWGETYLFDANAFCGATTVLLALVALAFWRNREVLFWAWAVTVILAFSLGKYSWFYDLCYLYVPWANRFRGVARLSIFAIFGLSVLAGIGLDGVLAGGHKSGRRTMCLAVGIPSAAALVGALWQLAQHAAAPAQWQGLIDWVRGPGSELPLAIPRDLLPRLSPDSFATMLSSVAVSGAALVTATLLIGWGDSRPWLRRICGAGLVAVLAVELHVFDAKYVVLTNSEPWRSIGRQMRSAVADDRELYRVAAFSENPPLPLNRLLYGRLQSVGGHENFVPYRYSLFLSRWLGIEPQWQTYLNLPDDARVYDLLNVKYYAALPRSGLRGLEDELVREKVFQVAGRDFSLYRNESVLPRVSLIHRAVRAADLESAVGLLEVLHRDGAIQSATAFEGEAGIALEPVSESDRLKERVTVVEYAPNRIVVDVQCFGAGLLLFSENYYPGWEAEVDGRKAPVLPANVFMRAVPVTAGNHRVEMDYRPVPFRTGCWCAAPALFVLVAGSMLSLWRSRRTRGVALV